MSAPIYSYSRSQAIEDGVLVDVSHPARILGYRVPVALTRIALITLCSNDDDALDIAKQVDLLLRTALSAIRSAKHPTSKVTFALRQGLTIHQFYAQIGPGDNSAPAITVMLKGED